jgi:hypothetical protein
LDYCEPLAPVELID